MISSLESSMEVLAPLSSPTASADDSLASADAESAIETTCSSLSFSLISVWFVDSKSLGERVVDLLTGDSVVLVVVLEDEEGPLDLEDEKASLFKLK